MYAVREEVADLSHRRTASRRRRAAGCRSGKICCSLHAPPGVSGGRFHGLQDRIVRALEEHHRLQLPHQARVKEEEVDAARARESRPVARCGSGTRPRIGRPAPARENRVVEAAGGSACQISSTRLSSGLPSSSVTRPVISIASAAPGRGRSHPARTRAGRRGRASSRRWERGASRHARLHCARARRRARRQARSSARNETRDAAPRACGSRIAFRMASASLSGSPGRTSASRGASHTRPHTEKCTCGGRHQPPVSGTGYAPGLMVRSSTRPSSSATARGAVKFGSTGASCVSLGGCTCPRRCSARPRPPCPRAARRPRPRRAAQADELPERALAPWPARSPLFPRRRAGAGTGCGPESSEAVCGRRTSGCDGQRRAVCA